mgnify:CR=1 FL=1
MRLRKRSRGDGGAGAAGGHRAHAGRRDGPPAEGRGRSRRTRGRSCDRHVEVQPIFSRTRIRYCGPASMESVRVLVDNRRDALLVPQRAVQEVQNLHSVAVVDTESRVAFRNVSVGPRVDTLWVIEEGWSRATRWSPKGCRRSATAPSSGPNRMPVATSGTRETSRRARPGRSWRASSSTGRSLRWCSSIMPGACSAWWRCSACRSRSIPRSCRR